MKKRLFTLLALAVMTISYLASTAVAQNRIFQKYDDMKDVEYICITHSMMKMLGNSSVNINGVNFKGLSDNIKVVIIVNTSNKDVCAQMKEDFRTLKSDGNYEILMQMKDNEERMTILFNQKNKDKELVMYIEDGDEQTFIVLTGQLDEEVVNKLIAK